MSSLRLLSAFSWLTPENYEKYFEPHLEYRTHPTGTALQHPFVIHDTFRVVISGKAKVTITDQESGRERILRFMGPGAFIGEALFLATDMIHNTVVTTEETMTAEMPREHFFWLLTHCSLFGLAVAKSLAEKVAYSQQMIGILTMASIKTQLLHLLTTAADSLDGRGPGSVITQKELGSMLGLSREAVNRHLHEMLEIGWVRRDGRRWVPTEKAYFIHRDLTSKCEPSHKDE